MGRQRFARLLFVLLLISAESLLAQEQSPQTKKLIEWGWDEPDTKFIRENIEAMEQHPFDGLVFHASSSQEGNFTWEMWGGRRFELSEFQHAIDDLRVTPFRRFTDRFLRVNVTPGKVDWFDDEAWKDVLHNFGVAAQIAKEGRCTGFMFDVEQYEGELFNYASQTPKPFPEYQAKVRQRGREWMQEVNEHFPDITILLTFGYRLAQPPEGKSRADSRYGLLADFLDGMLEACSEETRVVDAWEFSYPYKQAEQFRQAHDTIAKEGLKWTAAPEEYLRHVRAGFGLWMDYDWRRKGWNTEDFSKNHFTPEEFQRSVRSALETSDEYVWIYTEQPRWWTSEKLPQEYVQALEEARTGVRDPDGASATEWKDASPHASRFVRTNGIRLHYLDWGGEGAPLVFLPGLSCTAHIFDELAPCFTDEFRVLALTRRGFGQSDRPATGYGLDTRVADLLGFLDALEIEKAILVGHSMAGDELTALAVQHPERVETLVYLDAAYDGATAPKPPVPALGKIISEVAQASRSLDAFRGFCKSYLREGVWSDGCEAEMRERIVVQPDGSVVVPNVIQWLSICQATLKGHQEAQLDYANVQAPALAFFALREASSDGESLPWNDPSFLQRFQPWQRTQIEKLKQNVPHARIIKMPATPHFCFLREGDRELIVREMRSFLKSHP